MLTVTFENVCQLAYEMSSSILKCIVVRHLSPLFVLFLIKLQWHKNKGLH